MSPWLQQQSGGLVKILDTPKWDSKCTSSIWDMTSVDGSKAEWPAHLPFKSQVFTQSCQGSQNESLGGEVNPETSMDLLGYIVRTHVVSFFVTMAARCKLPSNLPEDVYSVEKRTGLDRIGSTARGAIPLVPDSVHPGCWGGASGGGGGGTEGGLVEVVVVTKCDGSTKKGQSQERESGKVRHAIAACLLVA